MAHACNLPPGDIPVPVRYGFRQALGASTTDLDLAEKMGWSEFVGIELPTRTGCGSDGLVNRINDIQKQQENDLYSGGIQGHLPVEGWERGEGL